ncbi:MAG: LysM peptidoglycan-binding domain-containing protein [Desulfobacterales bacterium]|nr:LysM peptidoglycan-binding domain-containing protein [Desulfobacterales bacterium]
MHFNQPSAGAEEQAAEQACPICGLERIPSDNNQCPQCDADLTCFKVLATLPDEVSPSEAEQDISVPEESAQEKQDISVPEESDQEKQDISVPEESDQEKQDISVPGESDQEKQDISVPGESDQEKHDISVPDQGKHDISVSGESDQERKNPVLKVIAISVALFMCLAVGMAVFQLKQIRQFELMLSDFKTGFSNSMDTMNAKLEDLMTANLGLKEKISELKSAANSEPTIDNNTDLRGFGNPAGLNSTDSQQLASDNQQPAAGNRKSETGLWNYNAKATDTLWSISRVHYGSGYFYPVLLEHNPGLDVYGIGVGTQIKILSNTESAKEIYNNITVKEGNRVYWNYTVIENDSLQSVARRFYKEDLTKLGSNLDPKAKLKPGQKIRILVR